MPQEAIAVPGFKPERDGPTKGDGYVKQQTSDRTWSGRSARSYSSIGHASVCPETATSARRQKHHSGTRSVCGRHKLVKTHSDPRSKGLSRRVRAESADFSGRRCRRNETGDRVAG